MGQKVNPCGFRVSPTLSKEWGSIFYAEKKDYSKKLLEDLAVRKLINKKYTAAQVSRIIIKRASGSCVINIYAKKPGIIIGKSGADIELLKKDILKIIKLNNLFINIHEVTKFFLDAQIVAQGIASQLENRVSFRKAMKTSIQNCLKQGGLGIKISTSGRLGGVEIARKEWYKEGRVPLHTLRSDIDYSNSEAHTTYGVIGVKVWIYRGEKKF